MPTYEYACPSCGAHFEAWQKITDDPITTCPTCGNAVHRVLFPVGLVFKGSGFYKTDSRGTSSASVDGGSTSASSETKSETKSESKTSTASASEKATSGASSSRAAAAS